MKFKVRSIFIFTCLLILSYINIHLFYIRFSVADDYLLNNIISGTFGSDYDYQLLYINNLLGIIMKAFYHVIPNINIYTFYLIMVICICYTKVIKYLLNKGEYIFFPVLLITYILTLFNITYTIVAYLSISIGLIDIIFNKPKRTFGDFLLIINGTMLRAQALIPVLLVIGVILIIRIFEYKDLKYLSNFFLIMVVCFFITICGNLIYKTDSILKEFKKWQDASIKLRDYRQLDYYKYEEVFKQIGWSENDLALFYSWNFADKDKYSTQNIEKVVDSIKMEDRYNLNYKSIINNFITQYFTKEFDVNNVYILVYVFIFVITIKNTKSKKQCFYVFISTIFLHIILIIRDRYPYRVLYPQYLIAIIYFIYDSAEHGINIKRLLKEKYILTFNMIFFTVFLIFYIPKYMEISNNYKQKNDEVKKITEQISQTGNLYIADSKTYNDLTMNYRITDRKNIGEYICIIKAGGGDCFSKRYYSYIEKYKLENYDNLYMNLISSNVYFIGLQDKTIKKYLEENMKFSFKFSEYENINNIIIYNFQIN